MGRVRFPAGSEKVPLEFWHANISMLLCPMRKKWIANIFTAAIALWIAAWIVISLIDGDYLAALTLAGVAAVFGWMTFGRRR